MIEPSLEVSSKLDSLSRAMELFFLFGILVSAAILGLMFGLGWWFTQRNNEKSPFNSSTRLATIQDLTFESFRKLQLHLLSQPYSEDKFKGINLKKIAICRNTGLILPNSVNYFGVACRKRSPIAQKIQVDHSNLDIAWEKVSGTNLKLPVLLQTKSK